MLDFVLPLIGGGLFFLLTTLVHAKNEGDVTYSELEEAKWKKELGVFSGKARQMEWVYRTTYRHPVLMRLPGVVLIAVALVILLVENPQLALSLVGVAGILIAAVLVVLLVEKLR